MITRFLDEVISRGADAVLPHALDAQWLDRLMAAGLHFLQSAARIDPETAREEPLDLFEDENGTLFLAAITELLQSRYDYPAHFQIEVVPSDVMYDSISCYALYLILEKANRTRGIVYPKPDADTILEADDLADLEAENADVAMVFGMIMAGVAETPDPKP